MTDTNETQVEVMQACPLCASICTTKAYDTELRRWTGLCKQCGCNAPFEAWNTRIQAEKRNNALAVELRALDALFQDQIELNPSNYDHDDACRLNTEADEICTNWRAVYPRILAALEGDE